MKTLLVAMLLTSSALAAHVPPVTREGALCPSGFHRNGAYCVPTSERAQPVIPRVGAVCPTGFHRNGAYCQANK